MMLITGATKGLGQFLQAHYECDMWNRGQPLPEKHYRTIIHCAHDHELPGANMNILEELFSIPCDQFIYISSVDVHKASRLNENYALSKRRCEQFVRSSYDEYLILRPCALLGTKPNSLTRMLRGEKLRVGPASTFAFIRYSALLPFIESGEGGTITLSGNVMRLDEIAEELGLTPEYGEWLYVTPPVNPTHDTMEEIRGFLNDTAADKIPA